MRAWRTTARRITRALALGSVVAAALTAGTGGWAAPAQAAPPGGPYHFLPPETVLDGVALTPGTELPLTTLDNHYVRLRTGGSTSEGAVLLGACGSDDGEPVGRASGWSTIVLFIPAGSCLSTTAATKVSIMDVGAMTAVDDQGLRYVAGVISSGDDLPDDARGVALEVTTTARPGSKVSTLLFHPCNAPIEDLAPPIDLHRDQTTTQIVHVPLNADRTICPRLWDGYPAHLIIDYDIEIIGYFTDALASGGDVPPSVDLTETTLPAFVPTTPTRVLDTRAGLGAAARPAQPAETVVLDLTGSVPTDAAAVTFNLTSTAAEAAGYVTAYDCGGVRPDTSNLNFTASVDVANMVTVGLGPSRKVCIYASATTHLLADIAGSWTAASDLTYQPRDAVRVLDTRTGNAVAAGSVTRVQIASGGSAATAAARAAMLTLTTDAPTAPGFATVYPCDVPRPTASSVNFRTGTTVANLVASPLAADGSVCVYSDSATHLIVDLAGTFADDHYGSRLDRIEPARLADTRSGAILAAGESVTRQRRDLGVDYSDGFVPGGGHATAVLVQATATQAAATGFLTSECTTPTPSTSITNFDVGRDASNLAAPRTTAAGTFCIATSATTHLLLDAVAVFSERLIFETHVVE